MIFQTECSYKICVILKNCFQSFILLFFFLYLQIHIIKQILFLPCVFSYLLYNSFIIIQLIFKVNKLLLVHSYLMLYRIYIRPKGFVHESLFGLLILETCDVHHLLVTSLVVNFYRAILMHFHFYSDFGKVIINYIPFKTFCDHWTLIKDNVKITFTNEETMDVRSSSVDVS